MSSSTVDLQILNDFRYRLSEINIDIFMSDVYNELDQWCSNSHLIIDEYYDKKKNQIDEFISKRKEKFEQVKKSVDDLGKESTPSDENMKLITMKIRSIERDLKLFEENFLRIRCQKIQLDDQLIHIENDFDVDRLKNEPLVIPCSQQSSSAMATNSTHLLIHQHPYLCLIDEKFRIVRQIEWKGDWIRDMIWSNTLNSFVLITTNELFLVDSMFKTIRERPTLKKNWFSLATSSTSLFLSTLEWGSSIYEFDLSSSNENFETDRQAFWTCESTEGIHDIQINDEHLALLIKDSRDDQHRMDLKSIETKETIWSLSFSKGSNIRLFTCSSINRNEWLITDGNSSKIHHVTKDGKLKNDFQYSSVPYRTIRFASTGLVVSAENSFRLHF